MAFPRAQVCHGALLVQTLHNSRSTRKHAFPRAHQAPAGSRVSPADDSDPAFAGFALAVVAACIFHYSESQRKARAEARALVHCLTYLLHPEQSAQQCGEPQHDTLGAFSDFAAPVRVSAATAINTTARIVFMDFSPFEKSVELLSRRRCRRRRTQRGSDAFLDTKQACLEQGVSSAVIYGVRQFQRLARQFLRQYEEGREN